MAASSEIHAAMDSKKIKMGLRLVAFFRDDSEVKSDLNWRTGIDTRSNLNSEALENIVMSLGLDYTRFQTKGKFIDEKLLGNRNKIAHGRYLM
jgi:RiboL-PSP-HEPN